MLVQRAASSGNEELERFLEDVAREVRALTADQGYEPLLRSTQYAVRSM